MFGQEPGNTLFIGPWLILGISSVVFGPALYGLLGIPVESLANVMFMFPSTLRLADQTTFPDAVLCWYSSILLYMPIQVALIANADIQRTFLFRQLSLKPIRFIVALSFTTIILGYIFFFALDSVLGGDNSTRRSGLILRNRFAFGVTASLIAYMLPLSIGFLVSGYKYLSRPKD